MADGVGLYGHMRREHTKPFSGIVIEVLADLRRDMGNGYRVFPSERASLTGLYAAWAFEKDERTSHGFLWHVGIQISYRSCAHSFANLSPIGG